MAKLFSSIAVILVFLTGFVWAHEEPPKSSADLADQDRIRLRISAAKIKTETWYKTTYSTDGKVVGKHLFIRNQYDRDGRQVREIAYDSVGKMSGTLEHVYDLNHQMLEQVECDGDSTCERTVFVYQPDHLMALAIDFNSAGTPIARLEYSYPKGDTVVHLVKRDSSQAVSYTLDYYFHPDRIVGYVVRAVKAGPDGKILLRTEQSGDAHGLVEKRVIGPDDKTTILYRYVRREDGQLSKLVRSGSDGKIERETTWEFGPHDLPVRQTTTDSAGHVLSAIEYQYDNW